MVQYQEGYDSNYLWTETYIKSVAFSLRCTKYKYKGIFSSGCVKLKIF